MARRWIDPTTGAPNPHARRLESETRGDLAYLARCETLGHDEAARRACSLWGHKPAGGRRCLRCGVGVTVEEARESRGGGHRGRR